MLSAFWIRFLGVEILFSSCYLEYRLHTVKGRLLKLLGHTEIVGVAEGRFWTDLFGVLFWPVFVLWLNQPIVAMSILHWDTNIK